MAAKCQIIKACGVRRRVCRDKKGRIKSNTVIGKSRKRGKRKARKAGKRRTKRRAGKRRMKRQRALARNIKCVRTKVNGRCRQICYRKKGGRNRMVSNDAAKGCGKRSIPLN